MPRAAVVTAARARQLAAAVVLALAITGAQASSALASAGPAWSTGVEAVVPAGAATNHNVLLDNVSCPSAGACSLMGTYDDSSGGKQLMLLDQSSGMWSNATEATLPSDAATNPGVGLPFGPGLSCASVGNCSGVGDYHNASGTQGLLVTESSGNWSTETAPLPSDAATDPAVALNEISCASAGNCVAVGSYSTGSAEEGLLLTESSGIWSADAAPVPGDAATDPHLTLSAVSCPSAGDCTAVGTYTDSSDHKQGLMLTESGGKWSTAEATLPGDAATSPAVTLNDVSCASAGNCAAVGGYSNGSRQGLLLSESSGKWSDGVKAALPSDADTTKDSSVNYVACASAGDCTGFGRYTDTSGNNQVMLVRETSAAWSTAVKAPMPSGAATAANPDLFNASCAASFCVVAGVYQDSSSNFQVYLASESGGAFTGVVEAALPANARTTQGADDDGLSCTPGGYCAATGEYLDSASSDEGLLLNTVMASPTLSVTAPSTAARGTRIAASSISASLASGFAPVGTVTFKVFGPRATPPTSCSSGGTTVGTRSVSGNGSYHPRTGFRPSSPGTYWWYARYGGDTSDNPAASTCGAGMAKTVVSDTSHPSISIVAPANGAHYKQGQKIKASYSCTDADGPADVALCAGPAANGAPVDTSTTGRHSFTVQAQDRSGNSSTRTVHYRVVSTEKSPPRITGLPPNRGCVAGGLKLGVSVHPTNLENVTVLLDGKRVASSKEHKLEVRIAATRLRDRARHKLTIVRSYKGGTTRRSSFSFATCKGGGKSPRIRVQGTPDQGTCTARPFRLVVTITGAATKTIVVRLDGKRFAKPAKSKFTLTIDTATLRAGPHRLTIKAQDELKNSSVSVTRFVRCG